MNAKPSHRTAMAVRSAERVLDVLEALQRERSGITLTELSRQLGIPKTSTHRYLGTLVARGYVLRDGDVDRYRLAFALQPLRTAEITRLVEVARPRMTDLCRRFGETINLAVLETNRITYLEIARPRGRQVFFVHSGSQGWIHCSALGKAIAATLHEREVRRILRIEGMPRRTSNTLTSAEGFIAELRDVRQRGFARDRGENADGGGCLAVAVDGGPVPIAISLSAPFDRIDIRLDNEQVDEIVTALRETAREIGPEMSATPA